MLHAARLATAAPGRPSLRSLLLGSLLLSSLATSCGTDSGDDSGSPSTSGRNNDTDGDGYVRADDCNDNDASIHPGAQDLWYDGIDSDCEGDDDYDADQDGYDIGSDCDDADASIHPHADDAWYDGVDSNCNGDDDFDADYDGYVVSIDCNDTDPEIHPGAADDWYDGVDSNCNGDDDFDADGDGYDSIDDCDDGDSDIYPGAWDDWYDGVDSDCAGDDDYDADGDGYGLDTDCRDTDADIYPGAPDTWYDGVDSDCEGDNDFDTDADGCEVGDDFDDLDDTVCVEPGLGVDLGSAQDYVILAKTGVSTVPTSVVIGDIGLSPAAASYITGFSLTLDSSNVFSTSSQVTGQVFAADYAVPTPSNMTTAIGDMETAFTDAAGRAADVTELGAGDIGGMTLESGVYKWGTGLLIPSDLALDGGASEVWIFQIAEDLTISTGVEVTLSGGARPENVYWQVSGLTELGTTSHLEGVVLCQTAVTLETGASVSGRLLAMTAVSIDQSTVVEP